MRIDELQKKSMIDTLKDIVQEYEPKIDRFTLNIIGQALWQAGWTISKRNEVSNMEESDEKIWVFYILYNFK